MILLCLLTDLYKAAVL